VVNGSLPVNAVGRVGDVAAFVAGVRAELVFGAADPVSVVSTTLPGGLSAPYARWNGNVRFDTSALGVVTAPHGVPDLVFADGAGNVQVLPGVLVNGRLGGFGPAITARAPGWLAGIVPQGPLSPSDLLVFTGEELLPLVWSGGVLE